MSDTVGALHRFEQRLEQMVTGAFARAFRSAVQPMEIAAALQREVDNSAQILSRDRRLAPNNFMIDLSGPDFDRLSTYGDTLSRELAGMLHEHAQEQHYMFAGPVSMNFTRSDDLTTGRFRVRSEASAAVTPAPGQPHMSDTMITRTPLFLEINGTRHPLEAPGLTIGRGTNADLRIDDPGVSRRHVEFRVQPGSGAPSPSVVDLGSTNGTTVNGQRVQHAALEDGSVVQIGSTRITVHVGGATSRDTSGAGNPEQPRYADRWLGWGPQVRRNPARPARPDPLPAYPEDSGPAPSNRRHRPTLPTSRRPARPTSASEGSPNRDPGTGDPVSELTLTLIKVGFLALLWMFVLSSVSVIKSDMFGERVDPQRAAAAPKATKAPKRQPRKKRGAPTQLVISEGANAGISVPLEGAADPARPGRRRDNPARRRLRLDAARPLRPARRRLVHRGPRFDQRHLHRQPAHHHPDGGLHRRPGPGGQDDR